MIGKNQEPLAGRTIATGRWKLSDNLEFNFNRARTVNDLTHGLGGNLGFNHTYIIDMLI